MIKPHLKLVERIDEANERLEYAELAGVQPPCSPLPSQLGQFAPELVCDGCRRADVGARPQLPLRIAAVSPLDLVIGFHHKTAPVDTDRRPGQHLADRLGERGGRIDRDHLDPITALYHFRVPGISCPHLADLH